MLHLFPTNNRKSPDLNIMPGDHHNYRLLLALNTTIDHFRSILCKALRKCTVCFLIYHVHNVTLVIIMNERNLQYQRSLLLSWLIINKNKKNYSS